MPAFAKNPKIVAGAIIVLWLAYVIYENFQLVPVEIHLLPWPLGLVLQARVSAIIIVSAAFGAALVLALQLLCKRCSSKTGSVSQTAAP